MIVVDPTNNRVQKFRPIGTFITKWGTAGSGTSQFTLPSGVAIASADEVYVVDSGQQPGASDSTRPTRAPRHHDRLRALRDHQRQRQLHLLLLRVAAAWLRVPPRLGGVGEPAAPRRPTRTSPRALTRSEVRAVDAAGQPRPEPRLSHLDRGPTPPQTTIDSGPSGTTNDASPVVRLLLLGAPARASSVASTRTRTPTSRAAARRSPTARWPTAPTPSTSGPPTRSGTPTRPRPRAPSRSTRRRPEHDDRLRPLGHHQRRLARPSRSPRRRDRASSVASTRTRRPTSQSCSSPQPYSSLADGAHTFEVRATDAAGNTDPTPASRTFTVDTTPPKTTIDSGPSGTDQRRLARRSASPPEPGSSFECRLDSNQAADFQSCSSPQSYARWPTAPTPSTSGPPTRSGTSTRPRPRAPSRSTRRRRRRRSTPAPPGPPTTPRRRSASPPRSPGRASSVASTRTRRPTSRAAARRSPTARWPTAPTRSTSGPPTRSGTSTRPRPRGASPSTPRRLRPPHPSRASSSAKPRCRYRSVGQEEDNLTSQANLKFDLRKRSYQGGAWGPWSSALANTSLRAITTRLSPGTPVQYEVRSRDQVGNVSTYKVARSFTPELVQETAATYAGTWATQSQSGASGGTVKTSSEAGATATFAFAGKSVGVVMPLRSTLGSVKICLDPGTTSGSCKTVDLSSGAGSRMIVFARNRLYSGIKHHVKITVLSGRADLDAFAVLR